MQRVSEEEAIAALMAGRGLLRASEDEETSRLVRACLKLNELLRADAPGSW